MKWRTTTRNLTIPIDFSWTMPVDVSAVVLLVALVDALSVGGSNATAALRALVGLPALLFVPGYLL
ncbi:MAG TPA: hypothetical protein VKA37_08735, partial [Halobacteriales archaeon]|nr:hypothetical protein [Halobacteriales archaeon]